MVKGCRPDNEEALWRQGEEDAEGYHLQFSQRSENFQSYLHLTFPEGIAYCPELNIVLASENFRLSIRFLSFIANLFF